MKQSEEKVLAGAKVLVVGGAGYIGAHTCQALAKAGFVPVVLDTLETGYREFVQWGPLVQGDCADPQVVADVLAQYQPVAVLHFAAKISVPESEQNPQLYYEHNVVKTLAFLRTLLAYQLIPVIFSSTAAVYGNPIQTPIEEDHPLLPINPYGRTKLMVESILADYHKAYGLPSICLRYFNAAGADPEAQIGEVHDPETHLIPLVLRATDTHPIKVFGTDYPTPDGTCIRDYIHVCDLASAHVAALHFILSTSGAYHMNLGTGEGASVLAVIQAAEAVLGRPVPHEFHARRDVDPAILVASAALSRSVLGWTPQRSDLKTIIEDALRWAGQSHLK